MCNLKKKLFESDYDQSNIEFLKLLICYFTYKYSNKHYPWSIAKNKWDVIGQGNFNNSDYCLCGKGDVREEWIIQYKENIEKNLFPIGNVCILNFDYTPSKREKNINDIAIKQNLQKFCYKDNGELRTKRAKSPKNILNKSVLDELINIFDNNKEEITSSKEYIDVKNEYKENFDENIEKISTKNKIMDTCSFISYCFNKGGLSSSKEGSVTKPGQKDISKADNDRYRFLISRFIPIIYIFAREKFLKEFSNGHTPVIQYLDLSSIDKIKTELQKYCITKYGMSFGEGEYIDLDMTRRYQKPSND